MILVVGGLGAGKRIYAREHLGFPGEVFVDARVLAASEQAGSETAAQMRRGETALARPCDANKPSKDGALAAFAGAASPSLACHVATSAEELVRTMDVEDAAALLKGCGAVLLREVGCGIVPVDAGEREWRERAGRLGCLLAAEAEAVVRVTCGIGRVVKGGFMLPVCEDEGNVGSGHASSRLHVMLVRHGATAGTENRRYCGSGTDELLSEAGMRQARSLKPDFETGHVFTSGLIRCDETARILFPNACITRIPGLSEMDFGAFEGKSYAELADDAAYQSWVDSWCETPCPGGESKALFTERVCTTFAELAAMECRKGVEQLVCVCHAGTIRALFSSLAKPAMPYFDVETDVLGSWSAIWDGEHLVGVAPIRGARQK